jgi:hypothetical protein
MTIRISWALKILGRTLFQKVKSYFESALQLRVMTLADEFGVLVNFRGRGRCRGFLPPTAPKVHRRLS